VLPHHPIQRSAASPSLPSFPTRRSSDIASAAAGTTLPDPPAAIADYVVEHYEDMLTLYGVESGLRQARKHLGWYLDRHVQGVAPDLRKKIMTGTDPSLVISGLRAAFRDVPRASDIRSAA